MDAIRRTFLPSAFLPLDEFGEHVLQELDEVLRLSEPGLLTSGWARVMPLWAADSRLAILKDIEELEAVQYSGQQANYVSPFPAYARTLIFLVGSLNLQVANVLEGIKTFIADVVQEKLYLNLRISLCLDVSSFVGETSAPLGERLNMLTIALQEIHWWASDWGINIFLFDKNSSAGAIATKRQHIQDAVRIFLEAITLGQHWDNPEIQMEWLLKRPSGREPRFATVSLLSMVSPQFDLRKYFASVSFHEVFTAAQAHPTPDDEVQNTVWPTLSRTALQALPPQSLDQPVEEPLPLVAPPPQLGIVSPGFFQSKKSYMARAENALNNFSGRFSTWIDSLRDSLDNAGQELMAGQIRILDMYGSENGELSQKLDDALDREEFIWGVENFGLNMEMRAKDTAPAKALDGNLMPDHSITGVLDTIRQELDKAAERLPNPFSLAIIVVGVTVLQILFTRQLLAYWQLNPRLQQVIFWGALAVWVLLGIYFAWRLPAADMVHAWREKAKRVNALGSQAKQDFDTLTHSLTQHWNARLRTSTISMDSEMARKIHLAVAYLRRKATEYRQKFPYEPANDKEPIMWEKVLFGPHPFKRRLETQAEVQRILDDLHKSVESLVPRVRGRHAAMCNAIKLEHVVELEEVIRHEILDEYGRLPFVRSDDLESQIANAADGWRPEQDTPLLPLADGGRREITSFHCVCSPIWQAAVEERLQLRERVRQDLKIVNLLPEDRIYFYRVFYDIPPDEIVT